VHAQTEDGASVFLGAQMPASDVAFRERVWSTDMIRRLPM